MTMRTIFLTAALAAAGSLLVQTPLAAAQPGQAPRARGTTPPPAPGADTPRPRTTVTPDGPPQPAPTLGPPRRTGQPINVRVDVTITDQRGSAAPVKKTVSVVVADSMGGRIRSSAESTGGFNMPLNVDAEPQILADGKIRLMLNLQYDLPSGGAGSEAPTGVGAIRRTQLQENLPLILESGKSMVVAQSADPIGDRQVTVEVKSTILR
jgi:hypothetical protein